MAENVLVLKKKAVAAGMDKKAAMKASRSQLEEFLSGASKPKAGATKKKAVKKGAVKKATKKAPVKKAAAKKNSKASKPAAKKNTKTPKRSKASDDGGRHMIDSLDFNETDGWNPRDGSPVSVIFKALKKNKGNVDKTTDQLLPNAKDFVGLKNQDGTKKSKAEIRNALRYRVNRTKWEFATRTGQHEKSENRIEYGSGAYAQRNKKAPRKAASKKSGTKAKVGAKKGAKKKTKKR